MEEAPKASRRQARKDAMVVLYQHELTGAEPERLYPGLEQDNGYPVEEYTRQLVAGVLDGAARLDAMIDRASRNWPAHRLAPLERNILRIAVYEIGQREDIPVEVSIDEAVTLAKRYSSAEAGSLVNGILSHVSEEVSGDEPGR